MIDIGIGSLTADRCEFWGGAVPWGGLDENKQRHGAYPAGQKSNLFNPRAGNEDNGSIRFLHCLMDGFWTVARNSGGIGSLKHHHCRIRYFGLDGSYAMGQAHNGCHYLRTQFFEGSMWSPLGDSTDGGNFYLGFCLWTNFRPHYHGDGYWSSWMDRNNDFVCNGGVIPHGSLKWFARQFHYNNTGIGAHNHHRNFIDKAGGAAMSREDNGAGVTHPWCRLQEMLEFRARNNIAAVFPNGSQGSVNNHPHLNAGSSGGSHVGYVLHDSNSPAIIEQNYNRYYRAPGMPSIDNAATITTVNSSGDESVWTNDITEVRTRTSQENNGSIGAPGFAIAFDASNPDLAVHSNAQWVLTGTGAAAATGGNTASTSWPDVDFGTEITYTGPAGWAAWTR